MYVGKEEYNKVWDRLQEMEDTIRDLRFRRSSSEESDTMNNQSLEEVNSKELGGDDEDQNNENTDSLKMKRNDDTKSR